MAHCPTIDLRSKDLSEDNEKWAVRLLKSPEGSLKIYHELTDKKDDTDRAWGFYEEQKYCRYIPKGERVVEMSKISWWVEHGTFEMEMSYEGETEVIKKRKEQFNAFKKQIEEDQKKQQEESRECEAKRMEKYHKKKKCCCSIL
ncbi:hypothetical protein CAEBREN_24035 [Caenorhabditis brenneri]|uniref:Uncharacterized protein n=1 Tax=Caenorhabditis brenneri TaxID=135651 RepID=G0NQQ7_CAEBE|nr:hypothetical protein CAEBREN_24035 [Caenorhabditis brenneri]